MKNWKQLNETEKQFIVQVHCVGYNTQNQTGMRHAFDDAAPDIEFGEAHGKKYVNVANYHVERMKLLINPLITKI